MIRANTLAILFFLLGQVIQVSGSTSPKESLACTIFADAGPDQSVCIPGDQVTLNGFVSDPFAMIEWTPATGLSNPFSLTPTATISGTITYTLEARTVDPTNLVFNGDFNMGAAGFSSDYIPGTGGAWGLLSGEGQYAIASDASATHTNFAPCTDHTGDAIGNMMVINGAPIPNQNIWCQTISVTPNTEYEFGTWVASVISTSPAVLQFSINGVLIGSQFGASSTTCAWAQFFANWNSGSSSSAEICIVNQNTAVSGNDFALDDITFNEVCTATDEVTITLNQPATTFITETVCPDNNCIVIEGIPYCGENEYVIDLTTSQGCDSTIILNIIENNPFLIIPNPDLITCLNPAVSLQPTLDTDGLPININWSGPNGFNSGDLSILVSNPGTYLLELDVLLNGVTCPASAIVQVEENVILPNADAGGNVELLCGQNFPITLDGSNSDSGPDIEYQWLGPGTNVNTPTVEINQTGVYTLLVTNLISGCSQSSVSIVTLGNSLPEVSPTADTLTCDAPSITIDGTSDTPNVTYNWSGPNGFLDSIPEPLVTSAGTYYVTVSAGPNCVSTDSIVISIDTLTTIPLVTDGVLTCDLDSINVLVTNPDSSLIYDWTGPGGYSNSGTSIFVDIAGNYQLTTTAANGCTQEELAIILADTNIPDITATGGEMNCILDSVILTGSSSTSGSILTWEGPNGYSSNLPNPTVSITGEYILSVLAPNGCESTFSVQVSEDVTPPDLLAPDVILPCDQSSIELNASSATGTQFGWTYLPDGTNYSGPSISVSEVGSYEVTTTAVNGCVNSEIVNLELADDVIDLSIAGNDLDCDSNTSILTPTSSYDLFQFGWTGPGGFSSMEENPEIGQAGTYNLTVSTIAGCQSVESITINSDADLPNISAQGGTIYCLPSSVVISGASTTTDVDFLWEGPNGFTSMEQSPVVSIPGNYTFNVLANNGCTAEQIVLVDIDTIAPMLNPTGADFTCGNSVSQLFANAPAASTINWTGPNGFVSNEPDPEITDAGIYLLTVSSLNGCTNSQQLAINNTGDIPDISLVGASLDCNDPVIDIQVVSSSTIVSYSWAGPNGFTSGAVSPMISDAGNYSVTITSDLGCENSASILINQNFEEPDYLLTNNESINCITPNTILDLTISNNDDQTIWSGPNGFSSNEINPQISEAGVYLVNILSDNGCSVSDSVVVIGDFSEPNFQVSSTIINCANQTSDLSIDITDPNINVIWSGAGTITGSGPTVTTNTVGDYQVEVIGTNGCSSTELFEVLGSTDIPSIQGNDIHIDCNDPTAFLQISSSILLESFEWLGPNGFTADIESPLINQSGTYTLIASTSDDCIGTTQIIVSEDFTEPIGTATGTLIDCSDSMSTISASFDNPAVIVSWEGPNGYAAMGATQMVNSAGLYIATATAPNGCIGVAETDVMQDNALPTLALDIPSLNCNNSLDTIYAVSNVSGGYYSWMVNDTLAGIGPSIPVVHGGEYIVTYDLGNGCGVVETVVVNEDFIEPVVNLNQGTVDCNNALITLIPESANDITSWVWSGPNGFSSTMDSVQVFQDGYYTLTGFMANGCSSGDIININADFTQPQFLTSNATITCNEPTANIEVFGSTTGFDFQWNGPDNYSSNNPNNTVTVGGNYTLLVTGANGCTQHLLSFIDVDTLIPSFSLSSGHLNCNINEVVLQSSDMIDGTYSWSGPGGFSSAEEVITVSNGGIYELIITPNNGCSNEQTSEVTTDFQVPTLTASGAHLDCNGSAANLNGMFSEAGNFVWNGPNGFSSTELNPSIESPGEYQLLFVALDNGCENIAIAEVTQDLPIQADVEKNAPLCFDETGTISFLNVAGGVPPYVYSIDGGENFSSVDIFSDLQPAVYNLEIQDAGECNWSEQITIDPSLNIFSELEPDIEIEYGDSVQLQPIINFATSEISSILWTPSEGLSCTDCLEPFASPLSTTVYKLQIETQTGCLTDADIELRVRNDKYIFIPNVFSPNNDGKNDWFTVFAENGKIEEIERLIIVDRWGGITFARDNFEPNDLSLGWDGTLNGVPKNPGVFIYYAKVKWKDGSLAEYKGDVTLIR